MKYPKTEPKANFPELEHKILIDWRNQDIFHQSLKNTESGQPFNFYDGPPFANNLPHWGHLGVSAVKDMVCRYQTMIGNHVERALGWDCHGVPAESYVEKTENRAAKDIVANDGIDKFCDSCRAGVMLYSTEWKKFIERIGRWVDMDDDAGYRTMDKNYMESVIWAIKELHDKGFLYKDFRVNPYDWKLGTVLSNSEASQDYRDIADDAITVWFELENGRRIMAWTTTPWTLPANSALAVNPNMKYSVIRATDGFEYIIAESRLKAYEKQFADSETVDEVMGSKLVGLKYKPLFDYYSALHTQHPTLYTVISADYVSSENGTGIVHIAPAFGEDDFWAAKNIDSKFPVILNVDDYGNFDETVKDWAGENIFLANPKIIEYLKKAGFLIKKEQYVHSYPYGERSKEKLIYRATDSWYIDVPKLRDRLIENNKLVNWTGGGERFAKWIESARPWSISRNRFWGTPLPIWVRAGEYKIFGSVREIEEFFDVKLDDLHRPTLDKLTKDGWTRIPDVLDCWVESGSMPFAQYHYPFENVDKFEKTFPADFIIEGQDQTRGWFYSLMVLATALFDKPAFKTVSVNGMVVDENKKKMSKSLGNFVNPSELIDKYGADAVRLFILGSNFLKTEPVGVDKAGTVFAEPIKNILTPLWNAYHFFTLYANAGDITVAKSKEQRAKSNNNVLDNYILAELNSLQIVVKSALDEYTPDVAVKEFVKFLDILNNWYIRLNRMRFWDEDQTAFNTLHFVITETCKLIAPFAPFISDYIYKNLTGSESVHLEKFPEIKNNTAELNDKEFYFLKPMRKIQQIVSVGKQLREKYGLRNRLPLSKIKVAGGLSWSGNWHKEIIENELNIKDVKFLNPITPDIATYFIFPITPKIGARLGGKLKEILPALKSGNYEIKTYDNRAHLHVADEVLEDYEYDLRWELAPGLTGAALPDNTAVVVLDTKPTDELIAEGLANDALRFIQDTRKTVGLDVSDRIVLNYTADSALAIAIEKYRDRIMADALITDIKNDNGEYNTEIEGYKFSIKITKI